ncbi:ankyrin repeat-containing domain protein, partial [Russula aff. rugulosa BPL654]
VARLLLDHGADVNASDKNRFTPLHNAALYGKVEVVRVLLEHGADVGAETMAGETAFQLAHGEEGTEIKKLLSDGTVLDSSIIYGGSLSHAAALYGKVKLVRMLLEHGANVGAEDDEDVTAFQLRLGRTWNTVVRLWCRQG